MNKVGYTEFSGVDFDYRVTITGEGNGIFSYVLEGKTSTLTTDLIRCTIRIFSDWPETTSAQGYITRITTVDTWTTIYTANIDVTGFMATPLSSDITLLNFEYEHTQGNAYSLLNFSSDWVAPTLYKINVHHISSNTNRWGITNTYPLSGAQVRYFKQGTTVTCTELDGNLPNFTYDHTTLDGSIVTTFDVDDTGDTSVYVYYTATNYYYNNKIIDVGTIDLSESNGILNYRNYFRRRRYYGDADDDFLWPCEKHAMKIFKFTLPLYSASGFTGNYVFNPLSIVYLALTSNDTTYGAHGLLCNELQLSTINWSTGYASEDLEDLNVVLQPGTYYVLGAYSTSERGTSDFNYDFRLPIAWEKTSTSNFILVEEPFLEDMIPIQCANTETRYTEIIGKSVVYRKVHIDCRCYLARYGQAGSSFEVTLDVPQINTSTGEVINALPRNANEYQNYYISQPRDIYICCRFGGYNTNYLSAYRNSSTYYLEVMWLREFAVGGSSGLLPDTIPTHTLEVRAVVDGVVYQLSDVDPGITGYATYFRDLGVPYGIYHNPQTFKEGFKLILQARVSKPTGRKRFDGWYDSYPFTEQTVKLSDNRMFMMNMPTSNTVVYCVYESIQEAFDWLEDNPKISGGDFNLTAYEWNNLKSYCYSKMNYYTRYIYGYESVYSSEDYGKAYSKYPTAYKVVEQGDIFTADECNDVISLLNTEATSHISSVSKAGVINASLLNQLKDEANRQNGFT